MENKKKAIVFAGGGSKGAYQLGAWKALNELGESFDIATGTSIGSINAAFYVQKDYDAAQKMWSEVTAGDIMANGINLEVSFNSIFSQRDNLVPFLKNYWNTKSVDNTPFLNMIQKYFSTEKFFSSEIDYALITARFEGHIPTDVSPVEITKADMSISKDDAWQWIAASSACFPVFPAMKIDGVDYIDGGYYDNIPVASAIKLGAEEIVVVDLKHDDRHEGYYFHPRVKYIRPTKDLGAFLNFNRNVIDRSIRLGYNDTMKVYGRYLGRQYTFLCDNAARDTVAQAASIFVDLLSLSEAQFDFSDKIRFQRVNKLDGCTTILSHYIEKAEPSETDIYIAAAELFLKALGYDDEKEYEITELLYHLKTEVDCLYPLLEFDIQSAFAKVREFIIANGKNKKAAEIKKVDEDRMMLIFTGFIRALQSARF